MPPRFNYQQRTPEQIAKRASGNTYEGFILDEFETYSPKKENQIRVLPPTWEKAEHYGMDIWVHYGVGPQKASVLCLWKMTGKPCCICEAQARAEAAGLESAKDMKPTRRVLAWVIDRIYEREKQVKKCFAWAMPATKVDTEIAIICKDRASGELYYIDDPDHGFDVFFDKTGDGINTDYKGFTLNRRESSVDDFYLQFIQQHPLPNILRWRTYEEVKALFEGQPSIPVQVPTPAGAVTETVPPLGSVPKLPWETDGWIAHPQAPGYFYRGQEVASETELKEAYAPQPPQPTQAPPPPPPPVPVVATPPTIPTPVAPVGQPAPAVPPVIHHTPVVVPSQPAPPPVPTAAPAVPPAPVNRVSGLRSRFSS